MQQSRYFVERGNDSFFSKLGIVQKEDAQTGNVIYLSK